MSLTEPQIGAPRGSARTAEAVLAPGETGVFRFLFRLAADSRRLSRKRLLNRLVTGLANHYDATTCRIYLRDLTQPAAAASDDEVLELMEEEHRARLDDLERRIVEHVQGQDSYASALDLSHDPSDEDFLNETLGVTDIFAFPVSGSQLRPRGAIVLYLPVHSRPLGEADLQALTAIGEVLRIASESRIV